MCSERNNYKHRIWKTSTKSHGHTWNLYREWWLVLTLRPQQNDFWSFIHYLGIWKVTGQNFKFLRLTLPLPKDLLMSSDMEKLGLNYNVHCVTEQLEGSMMWFQTRQNGSTACFRLRYIRHNSFPSGSVSSSLDGIGLVDESQYSMSVYTVHSRALGLYVCHMHMAAFTFF